MMLDSMDSLGLSFWGSYERGTTGLVTEQVRRGDIVLDVGAHIGYFSLVFARLVGTDGKVFAFEPNPENYALLEKNIATNGYRNIVPVRRAVLDTTGKVKLHLNPANSGSHSVFASGENSAAIDVESVRLDDYFRDYQGHIDFVKIDVEGAESAVVKGMALLLDKNAKIRLLIEFLPRHMRTDADAEHLLQLLSNHGFRFYRINERNKSVQPTTIAELLETVPPEDEGVFLNIFCTRD
jgi:FkbM family methyltransferase